MLSLLSHNTSLKSSTTGVPKLLGRLFRSPIFNHSAIRNYGISTRAYSTDNAKDPKDSQDAQEINEEPQETEQPSSDGKRSYAGWATVLVGLVSGAALYWDYKKPDEERMFTPLWDQLSWAVDTKKSLDPAEGTDNLLPPPPPEEYRRHYTLAVSLESLVSWEFIPKVGLVTRKRPGVDRFLASAAQCCELVIVSSHSFGIANQTIDKLDPNHYVSYRLFKELMKEEHGIPIKDLSRYGRELTNLILVDEKPESCLQPENVLVIPQWTPGVPDAQLLILSEVFQFLSSCNKYGDVKDLIRHWNSGKLQQEARLKMTRQEPVTSSPVTTGQQEKKTLWSSLSSLAK